MTLSLVVLAQYWHVIDAYMDRHHVSTWLTTRARIMR